MKIKFILTISLFILSIASYAQPLNTEQYFESIKSQPEKLAKFLLAMPKGGDLHNHATGAAYAENLIKYAVHDNLCLNLETYAAFENPNCNSENLLSNAIKNPSLYDHILDAWSMRHFHNGKESGHDHFFATFGKFGHIASDHPAEVLAEIAERAAKENESYLELMVTADSNASGRLGKQVGWNANFDTMRTSLMNAGLPKIADSIHSTLKEDEAKMRSLLLCDTKNAKAGCHITIRYQYQVLREQPPEMVFAQLLAGFEAANKGEEVVGLNMVQPEDGPISMRDYKLQMRMVGYLHKLYPHVYISLHAGELTDAVASPEGLSFHIHDAVNVAHANRIGHGVDISQEHHSEALLLEMARQHTLVEINLTSNAAILNVEGKQHPLSLYRQYNVPLALSTDDEGVNRSNLTNEFKRAVEDQQVNYATLKTFARNSITYSFLPGKSVWIDDTYQHLVPACEKNVIGMKPSFTCGEFLLANKKAALQWDLETRFKKFESSIH